MVSFSRRESLIKSATSLTPVGYSSLPRSNHRNVSLVFRIFRSPEMSNLAELSVFEIRLQSSARSHTCLDNGEEELRNSSLTPKLYQTMWGAEQCSWLGYEGYLSNY